MTVPLERRLLQVSSTSGGNLSEAINGIGIRAYRFNCSRANAGPNGTTPQPSLLAGSLERQGRDVGELGSHSLDTATVRSLVQGGGAGAGGMQLRRFGDKEGEPMGEGLDSDSESVPQDAPLRPAGWSGEPPLGTSITANPSFEFWSEAGYPIYYTGLLYPLHPNSGNFPYVKTAMITDGRMAHSGFHSLRITGPGPGAPEGERLGLNLYTFPQWSDPTTLYDVSMWVMRGLLPMETSLAPKGGFHFRFEPVGMRLISGNATWLELPSNRDIPPFTWVQLNATGLSFTEANAGDLEFRIFGCGLVWIDDFEVRYAGTRKLVRS